MQSGMVASQQQLLRKVSGSPPEVKNFPPSSPLHKPLSVESDQSVGNNNNQFVLQDSDAVSSLGSTRIKKSRRSAPSSSWLSVLNPSYKTRAEEFRKLFSDSVPQNERLVVDYSCALQKEILVHGRVYVTLNYICFYANIFKWETRLVIKCRDITSLAKAHTAKVIPNAIRIGTVTDEKYVLTSFAARDKTYVMMFRVWQNALLDHPMSSAELWSWVHYSYGSDLGFSSDEEEELKGEELLTDLQRQRASGFSDSTSSDDSKCSDASDGIKTSSLLIQSKSDVMTAELPECDEEEEQEESLPFLDPITCSCDTHVGKVLADQIFQVPVDTMYTLIFTESKFFKNMMNDRKSHDLKFTPWVENETSDDFIKSRIVNYTVTLNHTMIKSAPTTETQYIIEANPTESYRARVDAVNTEIPYCDTFLVRSHYCLTRGRHENEARLLVHAEVIFTNTSWSFKLVKPLIEKNAVQGISDFIRDLVIAMDKYCNEGPPLINEIVVAVEELDAEGRRSSQKSDSLNSRTSLRRRLTEATERKASWTSEPVPGSRSGTLSWWQKDSINRDEAGLFASLSRFVVLIILFLLLLNIFLFYHLWKLEAAVDDYEIVMKAVALRNAGHSPVPDAQAIDSLKKILTKAVQMAQTIEKNLQELNHDLSAL